MEVLDAELELASLAADRQAENLGATAAPWRPERSPHPLSSERAVQAFPNDTSAALLSLVSDYEVTGEPLSVSFRRLVPWIKVGERATHYIHPYPAKLLPHIAHFFLAARVLAGPRASVLDPFAGSGTVALETILSGRAAVYAEVNPMACLITRAKTHLPDPERLVEAFESAIARSNVLGRVVPPDVVNGRLWYEPAMFECLASIRRAIAGEVDAALRDLLEVTFSVTARKVSNADPRFAVPVRRKAPPRAREGGRAEVLNILEDQFAANVRRLKNLRAMAPEWSRPTFAGSDARRIGLPSNDASGGTPTIPVPDASIDLIITSPPYGSAQKYVRATSLSLGWLDLAASDRLSELEQRTIGREHIRKADLESGSRPCPRLQADCFLDAVQAVNPSRAAITGTYLRELDDAVGEMARVVKPRGYVVIVIGENQVSGMRLESTLYIKRMFASRGLELWLHVVDAIPSRGLMTKRNKTAAVMATESVLVFRKRSRT